MRCPEAGSGHQTLPCKRSSSQKLARGVHSPVACRRHPSRQLLNAVDSTSIASGSPFIRASIRETASRNATERLCTTRNENSGSLIKNAELEIAGSYQSRKLEESISRSGGQLQQCGCSAGQGSFPYREHAMAIRLHRQRIRAINYMLMIGRDAQRYC